MLPVQAEDDSVLLAVIQGKKGGGSRDFFCVLGGSLFHSLRVQVLVVLHDTRMTCSVVVHSALPDIVGRVQNEGLVFG